MRGIALTVLILLAASLLSAAPVSAALKSAAPVSANGVDPQPVRHAADFSGVTTGGLPQLLAGDVELRWFVPDDPQETAVLRALQYTIVAESSAAEGVQRVTLRSQDRYRGRTLTHTFVLTGEHVVDMNLDVPAEAVLQLAGTARFIPAPLPGFGAMYGAVRPITIDADGQRALEPGSTGIEASDWTGVRNRYHAVVVTGAAYEAHIGIESPNLPVVTLVPGEMLRFYAGPIEINSLRDVDTRLTGMLFAALWDWLRWLCFGMLWLLAAIDALVVKIGVESIGWSIVLLSLAVKVLMTPLTMLADRLQASVNRTQALLQPQLAEIKRNYKGEKAHERTLAVYRDHGVNPLYTMKSLVGFLIQIPIFIAAFDMLGENIALDGASWLWSADLAKPDHWLALPVVLPFFGGYLNLLPVVMTGVTFLTSWLQRDPHLSPELHRAQQVRLYVMAGAFFLLFYTFPAGMVLYWTTNNVLHLVKIMLLPAKPVENQTPSIS